MQLALHVAHRTCIAAQKMLLHRRGRSSGTTMIELLVAFTLLTAVLSAALPLVVRHGRLLASARYYRLALDEVSTQLDRLTALPVDVVREELDALSVSEFTSKRLADAKLTGVLQRTDWGQRLTLSLVWQESQRAASPVKLSGWMSEPEVDDASGGGEEGANSAGDGNSERGEALDAGIEEGEAS